MIYCAAQTRQVCQTCQVSNDCAMWEQILAILEDLEDAEELRQDDPDDEVIPWEQAKTELRAAGVDV